MPKLAKPNMFADTLYNLHAQSGASDEYARGVLVGVVGGLMATGISFEDARELVAAAWQPGFRMNIIPEAWAALLVK